MDASYSLSDLEIVRSKHILESSINRSRWQKKTDSAADAKVIDEPSEYSHKKISPAEKSSPDHVWS